MNSTTNDTPNTTEYGLCECGCGQKTNLATQTNAKQRRVKGEPSRFVVGHSLQPCRPLKERLQEKVDKGNSGQCWNWMGTANRGYGAIRVEGEMKYAHRVVWEMENGQIPSNLDCLHKCDNPSCCNPFHLFLGTHQDNMDDKAKKGRGGVAKLTKQDIPRIRELCASGMTQVSVGKLYGVGNVAIWKVITGKTWTHVP